MKRECLLLLLCLLCVTRAIAQTETGPEVARFNGSAAEISELMRTQFGWHLIVVENHQRRQDVEREQALAMARIGTGAGPCVKECSGVFANGGSF